MRLSFIGMSNIGKSFWAKYMAAQKGYVRIDCDGIIEQRLAGELAIGIGKGVRGLGEWMGLPHMPDFRRKGDIYMTHERDVTRQAIEQVRNSKNSIVIDTTGSVIYTGDDVLRDLRDASTVVYLEASEDYIDDMFKRYIKHPKPTIWDTHYLPKDGEDPHQTLQRCYPNLLRDRARRYKDIAHITLPFEIHRNHKGDIGSVIAERVAHS